MIGGAGASRISPSYMLDIEKIGIDRFITKPITVAGKQEERQEVRFMNRRKKRIRVLLPAAIVALVMLLGGCGADKPTGNTVKTVDSVLTAGTPTVGMSSCTSCEQAQRRILTSPPSC